MTQPEKKFYRLDSRDLLGGSTLLSIAERTGGDWKPGNNFPAPQSDTERRARQLSGSLQPAASILYQGGAEVIVAPLQPEPTDTDGRPHAMVRVVEEGGATTVLVNPDIVYRGEVVIFMGYPTIPEVALPGTDRARQTRVTLADGSVSVNKMIPLGAA